MVVTWGSDFLEAWGSVALSPALLVSQPAQCSALWGEPSVEERRGEGRTGLAVPTAWGGLLQTGVCGLASQGAGQEVLQVCGWGGVFGLTS